MTMTDQASGALREQQDTVAFVQEWMMSGDHEADQWHRDFAAAIDARAALSSPTASADVEEDPDEAAVEYAADYAMSTEGADYTPSQWDRELVLDALHGFIAEHWPKLATPQPERVGGEFVTVPREPTEAMLEAASAYCWQSKEDCAEAWKVWLTAAPAPTPEDHIAGDGKMVATQPQPEDEGREADDGGEAITAAARRMVAVQGMDWAALDGSDIGYWESLAAEALRNGGARG